MLLGQMTLRQVGRGEIRWWVGGLPGCLVGCFDVFPHVGYDGCICETLQFNQLKYTSVYVSQRRNSLLKETSSKDRMGRRRWSGAK